jgi:hypothetical protein
MKNYGLFIFISLFSSGFFACQDENAQRTDFEKFQYVYLTAARSGMVTVSLFSDEGVTFNIGGIQYGGTTDFNKGNISAELTTDVSLVNAYNTSNNTAFYPLPEECCSFDNPLLTIENGKHVSNTAQLIIKNVSQMDVTKDYLLPITVTSVKTSEYLPFSEEYKTAYFAIIRKEIGVIASEKNILLDKGQTQKANVTVTPNNVPDKTVIWFSSDPSVATVSSDGTIMAMETGTAVITAESVADPTKKVSIHVRVVLKSYNWNLWTSAGLTGMTLTHQGAYWEIVTSTDDPYFYGEIDGSVTGVENCFLIFEYQSDQEITDAQIRYFRPGGTGWGSHGMGDTPAIYRLEYTGILDPADADKWKTFTFDMTAALNLGWGVTAGYSMRFDPCNAPGHHIFIRNPKFIVE